VVLRFNAHLQHAPLFYLRTRWHDKQRLPVPITVSRGGIHFRSPHAPR